MFYSQQELGLSSSDEAEELEEEEAIEMQETLAATLSESDFLSVQALGRADKSKVGVVCDGVRAYAIA